MTIVGSLIIYRASHVIKYLKLLSTGTDADIRLTIYVVSTH